jgi:hypothetical protein
MGLSSDESLRFGLPGWERLTLSIVSFEEEGSGHALVDLVSGPEEG